MLHCDLVDSLLVSGCVSGTFFLIKGTAHIFLVQLIYCTLMVENHISCVQTKQHGNMAVKSMKNIKFDKQG